VGRYAVEAFEENVMRFAALGFVASVAASFALLPATASAAPGTVAKPAQASDVQQIAYCTRKAWRRGLCGGNGTYVRAPFAEVDTHGGTWVAAPFVRVYNGRYGTWVRAPFVNRWVPR
jgi:hypothetical protein